MQKIDLQIILIIKTKQNKQFSFKKIRKKNYRKKIENFKTNTKFSIINSVIIITTTKNNNNIKNINKSFRNRKEVSIRCMQT